MYKIVKTEHYGVGGVRVFSQEAPGSCVEIEVKDPQIIYRSFLRECVVRCVQILGWNFN